MIAGCGAFVALAAAGGAAAQNGGTAAQTQYLAANCANCHGTDGRSAGGIPGLAGLSPDYFIMQMKAFKENARPATIMHQLAKGYSDEQIAALAVHFSRLPAR
ncbi:MAG: c-type cytochrome [Burkholderiales bacterium]|nr:c-type cytochrome [Burkholderiales bacterium]